MSTLEELDALIARHDLTFEYSDDHRAWKRGSESLAEIRRVAKEFPREQVVEIWNRHVDRKLREGYRDSFYWKV
jgi:hypothetical protein